MRKNLYTMATFLCCVCLAASAQDVIVEEFEGPSLICEINLRDFMYAERTNVGPSKARAFSNSSDGVANYKDRITNMPEYLHTFIDEFAEAARAVLDGGSNWLSDPSKGDIGQNSYCHLLKAVTKSANFTFPKGSSSSVIRQAATDAAQPGIDAEYDVLKSFMPYALLTINLSHPEAFWIGTNYRYGCETSSSIQYNPNGQGTVTYTIKHLLYLRTSNYEIRNNGLSGYNFSNAEDLANGISIFHSSVQAILEQCKTGTRHDKLLAAHDWLTLHNCYNYFYTMGYRQESLGGMPWSALSALEGNSGQQSPVCEGYSRALKVLCDEMGIPCVLLSGFALKDREDKGEPHMWAYVQMENGKWYAVDVTWDDPTVNGIRTVVSGHESHEWFLVGSTTDVGGFTFIESHPELWFEGFRSEGSYSWDVLPGPQLATSAWTPQEDEDKIIDQKAVNDSKDSDAIYNLSGQRLQKMQRGINIVNGKKVIIR